jgi:N-methylhydantoinase A/oxoprolinase/acetone carboxylase beta subunit
MAGPRCGDQPMKREAGVGPPVRHVLDLRLGIDVGGTNTDAVVLDRADALVAKAKTPTSADVSSGIEAAVDAVLAAGDIDRARISHVMLGTTHATNAVLERRRLHRVAVLRIGAPATLSVRPLLTWPEDLTAVVSGGEAMIRGGIELDGREIVPFDADAVRGFLAPLRGKVDAVAITSVFAPVSPRHELAAADIAREVMGDDVRLSLSHELGSLGILERENSTVLNGALLGVARDVAGTLAAALERRGIKAALYFAQNDGTLMALEHAVRFPVLTIGSGPANSLRGAAYLTGRDDGIVVDVGGTSTDIGVLVGGFPRESTQAVEIGGVRTNFRMPDIVSIAIGGGTIVRPGAIGPDSVAWRISSEALAFGGATPTLTDAALLAGRASGIGSVIPGPEHAGMLRQGLGLADVALAEAIDRVKTSRSDATLIIVGGGSVLLDDTIPGASEILCPPHHDVANAIGAAIAKVSGSAEEVVTFQARGHADAVQAIAARAGAAAVAAGADPERVEVVDVEETPLTYLMEPAARIRVKAAGPLILG